MTIDKKTLRGLQIGDIIHIKYLENNAEDYSWFLEKQAYTSLIEKRSILYLKQQIIIYSCSESSGWIRDIASDRILELIETEKNICKDCIVRMICDKRKSIICYEERY